MDDIIYRLLGNELGLLFLNMRIPKRKKRVSFSNKNTYSYYYLSNRERFEKQMCFREVCIKAEHYRRRRRMEREFERIAQQIIEDQSNYIYIGRFQIENS